MLPYLVTYARKTKSLIAKLASQEAVVFRVQ